MRGLSSANRAILKLLAIAKEPIRGREIAMITRTWIVYPRLFNLEERKFILGEFAPGTYPRHRVYWITPEGRAALAKDGGKDG